MKVFLSGIAGTGMSSLAGLFKEKGFDVSGSDVHFYPPVDRILENMKVKLYSPYAAENITADVDFCVIGNIVSRGNPEAEHILNTDLEYYSMAEALYKFFIRGKKSVVVAGTHGKTTISSFISYLLSYAGLKPGFFIGGKPLDFDANYALGEGDCFVIEGDEYETAFFDRSSKFLKYHPHYLVLSVLEYDHLDFFPSESIYLKAFQNLVNQVPANGLIIANMDYGMNSQALAKAFTPIKTYGTGEDCQYRLEDITYLHPGYRFTVVHEHKKMVFTTTMNGKYNAWNLTAGIILGLHLGISEEVIREAVASFSGVERRLNKINEIGNTLFLEDFAHHPTAIQQVLTSVRESYPQKKIIAFFEPRSWSLRRNFFQERLAESFLAADVVFFKDVYEKEKIALGERLDVAKIKLELEQKGKAVNIFEDFAEVRGFLQGLDYHKDHVVVILSNGSFGDIPRFVREDLKGK